MKKNFLSCVSVIMIIIVIFIVVSYSFERNLTYEYRTDDSDEENPISYEQPSNQPVFGINYIQYNKTIFIDDNSDFLAQGFTGSGTPSSPYLLENRSITNSTGHIIHISGTTANFIIKNCILNALNSGGNGIYINDVTNGIINNNIINSTNNGLYLYHPKNITVTSNMIYNSTSTGLNLAGNNVDSNNSIVNNTIYNCIDGIWLHSSMNNTAVNNTIYNCSRWGFVLSNSPTTSKNKINNFISNNTIYNCRDPLFLMLTSNNTVTNNHIEGGEKGIDIDRSKNNTISNNTIYNCKNGIYISNPSSNNIVSNNTIYDCSQYGILLLSITVNNNNSIVSNTIHNCKNGIYISYSSNNTILNNTIYNCSDGMYITCSNNNNFINNTIYNCGWCGIILRGESSNNSNYNTFSGNTIYNTIRLSAIELWNYCNNNTFIKNIVYNNTGYGFNSGSSNDDNTISLNDFVNNNLGGTSQAADDINNNNNISYNYWNDWTIPDGPPIDGIVDIPYAIDGGAGNQDLYPLTYPVLMDPVSAELTIITPITTTYTTNNITVMLSGNAIHYWYYITGDMNNLTWTGSINRTLTDGTYTLHAYGNNTLDNETHDSVTFTIDTIAPTVTIINPINTTYSQNNVILEYTVSDGMIVVYINDVVNTTSLPNGSIISIISGLSDGINNITIVAMDLAGNIGRDTIIFAIDFPHILTTPEILTPNHGVFSKEILVEWTESSDSYDHQISYDLYYSDDGSKTWNLIALNVSGTTFKWIVTDLPDSSSYQVKLVVKCTEGTTIEVISSTFTIKNNISNSSSTTTNITPIWSFPLLVIVTISLIVTTRRKFTIE